MHPGGSTSVWIVLACVLAACSGYEELKPVPLPPPGYGWRAEEVAEEDLGDPQPATAGLGDSLRLRVMTFNVRYASPESPNAWAVRRPVLLELVRRLEPDILGTQEPLYEQVQDIDQGLPAHDWIGLGRDGGSAGEFMAVFYRRERLEPQAFDHYWLSDTPDVIGSSTWGNGNRRMVTWVRFRDRLSGDTFVVLNTHFDHEAAEARFRSAGLVVQRLARFDPDEPVLLLGDFNAAAGDSQPYEVLVTDGPFDDTWDTALRHGAELGTFGGWADPQPGGARIDWILARGPWRVLSTDVVSFERNGQYPSDHFPVMADMVLEET